MEDIIIGGLVAAIRMATPLIFAGVGELFSQRSGVLNIGCEGFMIMGGLGSLFATYYTGNPLLGLFAGIIVGALIGLLHAFICLTLQVSQGLVGFTFVRLGWATSALIMRLVWPTVGFVDPGGRFEAIDIPGLSQIPIIGPILFRHNILVYLAFSVVFIFGFIIFRTTFGLKVRSVGENPRAADTLGVNVNFVRYVCTVTGGAMAGLGGAYMTLAYSPVFTPDIIAGRGWMSIALVTFSNWNPYLLLGGALLFGGSEALQMRLQAAFGAAPELTLVLTLPYVVTIVAMIFSGFRKRSQRPSALARPYVREKG